MDYSQLQSFQPVSATACCIPSGAEKGIACYAGSVWRVGQLCPLFGLHLIVLGSHDPVACQRIHWNTGKKMVGKNCYPSIWFPLDVPPSLVLIKEFTKTQRNMVGKTYYINIFQLRHLSAMVFVKELTETHERIWWVRTAWTIWFHSDVCLLPVYR